jgi:NADPH2:quinone reductase
MRAVQITEFGGPEVLKLVDLPDPVAGGGQVVVDVTSAGVNYADTHQVEDSYLQKSALPMVPGSEVVGHLEDGTRVSAFAMGGGYCEKALVFPQMAFPLPDAVSDGQALSLMVQGLTAWHLLRTCTHLQPGESVVVHAAAGGVGTLAVQLAKHWGAGNVIAVASSEEKLELAKGLEGRLEVGCAGEHQAVGPRGGERRQEGGCRPRDGRRADLRRLPRRTGPLRPPGHLRDGVAHPSQAHPRR